MPTPLVAGIGAIGTIGGSIASSLLAPEPETVTPTPIKVPDPVASPDTESVLATQLRYMPKWYHATEVYAPKYADLNMEIAQKLWPDQLRMYSEGLGATATAERESDALRIAHEMAQVRQYAPEMAELLRSASGNKELLALLNADAAQGMSGSMIDPALAAQTAQSARAAQAARGMFMSGMPAINEEAVLGAERANAIRNQNRAWAAQVAGINQATGGDPFLALLGRPSSAGNSTEGLFNQTSAYNTGIGMQPFGGIGPSNAGANSATVQAATANQQAALQAALANQQMQWNSYMTQPSLFSSIGQGLGAASSALGIYGAINKLGT